MHPAPSRSALDDNAAFRAIFEAAPYGLALVDKAGRIVVTNPRLDAKLGYDRHELVGQPMEVMLPERHRGGHGALRTQYAQNPSPRIMGAGRDLTALRKDGVELPVEVALCVVDTPEGELICATLVDITLRKLAEVKLREANAQLEEFTYVASHDLRSPLRGIGNLIDFIREDLATAMPAPVERHLERMASRISHLERLIDDLLIYARASRRMAKRDVINLPALVAGVVELEAPGPEVTLLLDLPAQSFEGAYTPLATILRNLLSNAIKHHDRKGKTISIRAHFTSEHCIIEVEDDGPGIPEAAQARIFRLFQTLSTAERKGSGLGLAVVQRMVDGHGGTIEVISDSSKRGACFKIGWPRYARSDFDD
jgi:PAS domain S-box-containing protein